MTMDKLWADDPEEVLLELGFGCEEPDLSGRIPARFINYRSQARGINLQVFLEAQKNRLDLENPDVSNRFRELEVLQEVTAAFSCLVGPSSSFRARPGKGVPPDTRDRRIYIGMILRRASKKALHNHKTQDLTVLSATSCPCASPEALQTQPTTWDKEVLSKQVQHGLLETGCLSPLAEQGAGEPQPQLHTAFVIAQEEALRPLAAREGQTLEAKAPVQWNGKKSPGQAGEPFEMKEIQCLDECVVTGIYTGGAEHLVQEVMQTISSMSDSSGFLEENFSSSLSLESSSGPALNKALSGGRPEVPNSERPGDPPPFPPHTPPTLLLSSSMTPSGADKSTLSLPCPSLHTLVFGPDLSHVSSCLQKCEEQILKTETYGDLSPPASLVWEYLNITDDQTETLSSIASSNSLPPPSTPVPTSSLRTEDKPAPSPNLCTVFHDTEAVSAVQTSTSISFFSKNVGDPFSAGIAISEIQSEATSGNPVNTQSEGNSITSLKDPQYFSGGLLSPLPYSTYSPPYPPVHFHSPHSLVSHSQSPNNFKKDSLLQDSCGMGLLDPRNETQRKKSCATLPCLSLNYLIPVGESSLSLQSHKHLADQSISHQDRCSHTDNTDAAPAFLAQDSIHVKRDHSSLDLEAKLGNKVDDTEQTSSGLLESCSIVSEQVCKETEIDPQILHCGSRDELLSETKPRELQKEGQMEMKERECGSSSVLDDNVERASGKGEAEQNYLVEIKSLDLVFQTSVDGSAGDSEDADAFLQQLDTEELLYWAEPVQVYNTAHMDDESVPLEAADGSPGSIFLPRGLVSQDSFLSTISPSTTMDTIQTSREGTAFSDTPSVWTSTSIPSPSPSITPDLQLSNHSVSVQMSSTLSSHIVNRKDVPYLTYSKFPLLSGVLPLDTSSPYRAVQSWTDLHIRRNKLTKMLSEGALHTFQKKVNVSVSASETTQRQLHPSLTLLSNGWQSHDSLPGMKTNGHTVSVSEDKGLGFDEEEQVDNIGNENDLQLWGINHKDCILCCVSFDHQCTCCSKKSYNKQHNLGNNIKSLDDIEEMKLCLQQFCFVLSNMQKQLSEDQAAINSFLSDQDREMVRDVEKLRNAVKQETVELETQLNEVAHHNNDSLKKKMHRLLDEQSLLCSQLGVFIPGAVPRSLSRALSRTVSTQCCLLPWLPLAVPRGSCSDDPSRGAPPGTHSVPDCHGCPPTKAERWT